MNIPTINTVDTDCKLIKVDSFQATQIACGLVHDNNFVELSTLKSTCGIPMCTWLSITNELPQSITFHESNRTVLREAIISRIRHCKKERDNGGFDFNPRTYNAQLTLLEKLL